MSAKLRASRVLDKFVKHQHTSHMAAVVLSSEATENLKALPAPIVFRFYRDIVPRLEQWPAVSGCKPLRGSLAGYYRIRTGDYRFQFRVERTQTVIQVPVRTKKGVRLEERTHEDYRVIVERAGHRDGFYE